MQKSHVVDSTGGAVSHRLEPQDVVVALKLVAHDVAAWTPPALATALHMAKTRSPPGSSGSRYASSTRPAPAE